MRQLSVDGILFDLDGTLWDATAEIMLTWNQVLKGHGRPPISRPVLESIMGLQMDEIARRLFPDLPPQGQTALLEECVQAENQYLWEYGGVLYPKLRQILEKLHTQVPLFIVSNCQSGYIEAFLHAHTLGDLFSGHICFGDTGLSKGENIRRIVTQYGLMRPVYVGDTQGDRDASALAGVPFLYASYGFGQVDDFTAEIKEFSELLQLLSL